MRLLPLFLVLVLATGCRTTQPVAPTADAPDLARLQLENDRLRRLLEADCPPSQETYRGETVAVLLADVFFESGSADLTPEGFNRLDEIGARLNRDYAGRRVRVEGHTDTQPIGPTLRTTYPTNWELSTARATAVLRYLQEQHRLDPAKLEAVGMGAYDPVDTNTTAEGRARNRRVRIAVLPE